MTNLQLELIAEVADMLHKGMTNPVKINQAYKYINTSMSMEVPIRVKMNAINRYMVFNYDDELKRLKHENDKFENETIQIDLFDQPMDDKKNKNHSENLDVDLSEFLTKDEKDLSKNKKGTEFIIKRGRPKSNA